jgi:cytochrome c oxidase cbb3-type subunit 3
MALRWLTVMAIAAAVGLAGCDSLPGKPRPSQRPISPSQVKSFSRLYAENCAGCHGADGRFGAAYELAEATYQSLVDDATLTRIISNGMAGTAMPAFAQSAGGYLSSAQVAILVHGMRERWKTSGELKDAPPYAGANGDAGRGAQTFAQSCAPCHGPQGEGGPKAPGSITDPSYLALVSDQALRTLIVAGRSDLGHPDWRDYPPGQPLTAQQVADVVAWMASKRRRFEGGGYAAGNDERASNERNR